MVWVTYDPGAPFPQDADFESGVTTSEGVHSPPAGLSSFLVPNNQLTEGVNQRFYQVTAADVLTPRSAAEIQAIKDADAAEQAARRNEKAAAAAEISSGPADASVPALRDRVTAIEHYLGLRSDV